MTINEPEMIDHSKIHGEPCRVSVWLMMSRAAELYIRPIRAKPPMNSDARGFLFCGMVLLTANDLSNKEIVGTPSITLGTRKWHLRNV